MFTEAKGTKVPCGGVTLQPPFASLSFSLTNWGTRSSNNSSGTGQRSRGAFSQQQLSLPFAHIHTCDVHSFGHPHQEPATAIDYPGEFCILTKKHCPQLAGAGVRAKRILGLKNINVYAVGLYVDCHGAKKALHKYKGLEVDGIMVHQEAFDELVTTTHFERSLRLVISFGSLKRSQFVNALQERLKPALDKVKEPASTLKSFEALFDGVNFKKGLEIGFATHHKGQLVTQIGGKQVGTIHSPALVKALFDIYLGPDPVSSDAKRAFGVGLAALLNE